MCSKKVSFSTGKSKKYCRKNFLTPEKLRCAVSGRGSYNHRGQVQLFREQEINEDVRFVVEDVIDRLDTSQNVVEDILINIECQDVIDDMINRITKSASYRKLELSLLGNLYLFAFYILFHLISERHGMPNL